MSKTRLLVVSTQLDVTDALPDELRRRCVVRTFVNALDGLRASLRPDAGYDAVLIDYRAGGEIVAAARELLLDMRPRRPAVAAAFVGPARSGWTYGRPIEADVFSEGNPPWLLTELFGTPTSAAA